MPDQNKKLPVVLLIAEGINFSSSWHGNSLLSAKPKAIFDLWEKFPHTIISSDTNPDDDRSDFITMSIGHKSICDNEFLKDKIKDKAFFKSEKINSLYDNVIKNKAALHLIGLLDSGSNSDNMLRIFAMLDLAKSKRIYRAYLHIILQDHFNSDTRQILTNIHEIERYAQKIGVGEIASIVGINSIKNGASPKNFKSAVQSIVNGSGLHALSFEQAITLHRSKHQTISDKSPVSIIYQNKSIGKFNTFDTVIFIDTDTKYLSDLILYLSKDCGPNSSILIPKFVTVATVFESIDQKYNNVVQLFSQNYGTNISKQLAGCGLYQYLISDSSRIQHFNSYLLDNSTDDHVSAEFVATKDISSEYFNSYHETLDSIYNKIVNKLEDNKYDFFIIDVPAVYHACQKYSFASSIKMVNLLDSFIKKVSLKIFELNGALLLTTLNNSKLIKPQNNIYFSPFIFSMKDIDKAASNNSSFQNQIMLASLKKTQTFEDIYSTVFDIFGLDIPKECSGKSLLDKKVLY